MIELDLDVLDRDSYKNITNEEEQMRDYSKFKGFFNPIQIQQMHKFDEHIESLDWSMRQVHTLLDGYPEDTSSEKFRKADELNNQGWFCHSIQNYRKALQFYEEALKLCHDFPMVWNNKGLAHYRLNEFDNAYSAYQEAININPRFIKPYSNLGILYFELRNDKEEARIWFSRALALDPNYQRAKMYMMKISSK